MCQLYSAGLPPQCLVELQFRDRLCIDTRIVQQPIIPGFDGGAHPGGSERGAETLAVADAAGLAVVHTGVRHFRH